jgi:lactoylglutathione lyase
MQFSHTILYVSDIQRSLAFYGQALGLKTRYIHDSGQYAELDTGTTKLAFSSAELARTNVQAFTPNDATQLPAGFAISLMVEDVPAIFAKAVEAGAASIAEPDVKPWGQHLAYVRDLDGILIELNKWIG